LTPSPRGKKRFTYSPRRTDIAIVVFQKMSETKICGNLQLFRQLSRFVVANRSIWVQVESYKTTTYFMDKLKVAIIQSNLIWENSSGNLDLFNIHLKKISQADIVVLPEMFNTGFTQNVAEMAQPINGPVVSWMKKRALENNYALLGSLIIKEDEKYFNRFIMAFPCTDIKWYDKRHLFRMGGEHENFTSGTKQQIFSYIGWRIKPLICYDLRFPVWSRNKNNYDLLVYVSNWPQPRREVWITLLKARAIENQCYVIGVNRVGTDGMGIEYSGDSMVIGPKGEVLCELPKGQEGIGEVTLSLSELEAFRTKFPVFADADTFTISGVED